MGESYLCGWRFDVPWFFQCAHREIGGNIVPKQSIIDCKTGSKTYSAENYDEDDLIALAEELGDEIVPISGDGGGGLRRFSKDGNILVSAAPFWPMEKIIFMPNYTHYTLHPEQCIIISESYEIKAFGFSKCGNYIAVGTSDTLDIFSKI